MAGTGHRPDKLGGYGAGVSSRLVDLARAALLRCRPNEVMSGMALGWDTALALGAIELGIPLTAHAQGRKCESMGCLVTLPLTFASYSANLKREGV